MSKENGKLSFPILEIQQPIGTFYLSAIPANVLLRTVKSARRSLSEGVQRDPSNARIRDIATFCSNQDAVFPTPIIVSVDEGKACLDDNRICFDDNVKMGDILDGQHRLLGLQDSELSGQFVLPVVFMFGLNAEEKAYIFSIINSKQTKVSSSLLYDLFGLTDKRSPQKTAHELARSLNSMEDSPFFNRLKMLGKKEYGQDKATLSQGIFAQSVMMLYSKKPDEDKKNLEHSNKLQDDGTPLRKFFLSERDDALLKILFNCFNALKNVFNEEWKEPDTNILWKSTGFRGVMKALPTIISKGVAYKVLTQDFFQQYFAHFKQDNGENEFTSDSYGSGEAAQNKLCKKILSVMDSFKYNIDSEVNEK